MGPRGPDRGPARYGRAELEAALELDPENPAIAYNLGIALEDAGDLHGAVSAYRRAAAHDSRGERARYNLARVLEALDRPAEAERAYREALAIRPHYARALNNLANLLCRGPRPALEEALRAYERATELEPDFADAWCNRGLLLNDLRRHDEALACFERAHALAPANPTAEHMRAALSGEARERAPHAYVASLFDGYAASFDEHLTGPLDYRVPDLLGGMLERCASRPREAGLDLGCGTGLFGVHMRPWCRRLSGVDLSRRMIDVARTKGVYDELVVDSIESHLAACEQSFDLVAAADVLIYCGDLAPILAAAAARMAADGLLLFSTEALERGDLELRRSGRFAHGRNHVLRAAEAAGLRLREHQRRPIRSDREGKIAGDLYVFEKPREGESPSSTGPVDLSPAC